MKTREEIEARITALRDSLIITKIYPFPIVNDNLEGKLEALEWVLSYDLSVEKA